MACDRKNPTRTVPPVWVWVGSPRGEGSCGSWSLHPMPESLELAFDAHNAPARVLPGHPDDQIHECWTERWSAYPCTAECPSVPHEFAMPPQDRCRRDDEPSPSRLRYQPGEPRDHDPVTTTEPWPRVRPAQDRELMTQDQDLGLALAHVRVGSDLQNGL